MSYISSGGVASRQELRFPAENKRRRECFFNGGQGLENRMCKQCKLGQSDAESLDEFLGKSDAESNSGESNRKTTPRVMNHNITFTGG